MAAEAASPCHVWLDRSAGHRTAGRSVQQVMGRLRRKGSLLHSELERLGGTQGYEPSSSQWATLARALGQNATAPDCPSIKIAAQVG